MTRARRRRGRAVPARPRAIAFVALVCCSAAIAGCGRSDEGEALARVDGKSLTVEDFYASIPEHLLAVMSLEDQQEALETWVKTELFYREGVRRGIGRDDELRRRLEEIEREMVAQDCIERLLADVEEVTDAEAEEYFVAHRNDYAIQVRLAHILVRSFAEAKRSREQIRGGAPFETVAAAVSVDRTASLGGDLGYMRRGEMIHELEEVAFDLNVGEVSDVIESSFGYHIIKVLDRHPGAGQPSYESKRAAVMNFLTSQRRRRVFDEWLDRLEGRASVVVDTAALRRAARERIEGKADAGFIADGESSSGDSAAVAP